MDGYMPVKVNVPLIEYRRMYADAQASGVTVADLIIRRVSPPEPIVQKRGRPSGYSSKAGEELSSGRRFGMSWVELGRALNIDPSTARAWHIKYENEVREQNMRESAERKSA